MTPAPWLDEVRRVLEHVRASDATHVEVASGSFRLRLVRKPGRPAVLTEARTTVTPEVGAEGTPLLAPLTGVFYRAPSPTTAAYVEVGDRVESGAVVGLIETMKIFNEVLAERRGQVTAILAEAGQLVHAGDTLMTIDETAEPGGGQAQP